ncbi:peptidoglycan DD-metalloendopeptidase family protein [Alkaliphilus crotonatoxidans]
MSFDNNQDNNKKNQKKSLYQFLDKEGFYIILFLCVCIVAVTAIWVSNQNQDPQMVEEPPLVDQEQSLVEGPSEEEEPESSETFENVSPKKDEAEEEKTAAPEADTDEEPQSDSEEKTESDSEETAMDEAPVQGGITEVMALPVIGRIGLPYADDRLVYHKTLDQWSTHKGVDILADEGTPVRAALPGEVIEVVNDTIMGITITLAHEGDVLTRYSNLSTDAMVQVGDYVTKGQIISGVGRTASIKSEEGPLLHFQVIVDSRTVDPQLYLPKN